ncbi:MAG: YXWGXW repeat-containing protein, partial [Verrucomicrobia bacterium]|nr:YXWGXW repeat-containing protein [Leptolyngbya sp. ES-bin-22]
RAPARTPVVVQAPRRVERRVWVAGRWDYSRRSRVWVPGHYEYRR